ncbi:MAG: amidohydrolase family protein [Verrucomicrobia bacterium]|jgi:imidazolonepropionase-like amidohydrolase|nr:amidohydrolase family protein [Verrucomicrobiota bacterium]
MAATYFQNVNIVDATGKAPFLGCVLVDGERIKSVKVGPPETQSPDVKIVDGEHQLYLMPGLIESHAHLSIDNTDDLAALGAIPVEEHTLMTMYNAKLYLDHGITSCISAASAKPRLDLVIRNAINEGKIPGPRLLAATPWLTVTGGLGDMRTLHQPYIESMAMMVDGPDEYRKISRELIREGVDIIKLVVSGDSFVPHAGSETTIMSEAEVAAAAEVVHAHGKRMSAHARSAESVKRCVRNHVKVIYHANFADEEAMDMLEANRDWVFISPNIGFTVTAIYDGAAMFTPQQVEAMGLKEELAGAVKGLRELKNRGIRILGGGDYGFALTPHGQNANDIGHLIQHAGFTPMEALQSMTKHGGAAMDLPDELGQILPTFYADLLLINANPLENPNQLTNQDNLVAIMKNGHFHKKPVYSID